MSRGQLLRVLGRGFAMECIADGPDWTEATIAAAVEEIARRHPAQRVDATWRRDLSAAYAAMRAGDPRRFAAEEAVLSGALAHTPLAGDGYTALAARMLWNDWRSLTGLFLRVDEFLSGIRPAPGEPGELSVDWAAARFLLDGKRAPVHERRGSHCFPRVDWSDVRLVRCGTRPALEHVPGSGAHREPLETIQAAMLELVVPVLPDRLRDPWRQVLARSDVLDVPGLRAGRQGVEQGKRQSADTLDEQLEILKRGKVAYLFEHYTEQLRFQTLLLLVRGGNLEVTSALKHHVDQWGRARYGVEAWPQGVPEGLPALFVGLTGIDEEFRGRGEFAEPALYDARLSQLADALGEVAAHFGGKGRPFTNIYPLRYPGTWDATAAQRRSEGEEKWLRAGRAFVGSGLVRRHVDGAADKWSAALADDDGGWSAVGKGLYELSTDERKREAVGERLAAAHRQLSELAARRTVDTDGHVERDRRTACAAKLLEWLTSDARQVYDRVAGLRHALCLEEGDQYGLSDATGYEPRSAADRRSGGDDRFDDAIRSFWRRWADGRAAERWERFTQGRPGARPWPAPDEIGRLAGYLKDYFLTPTVRVALASRLLRIVGLQLHDESARREARRRYVRLLLNDLILTPGLPELRQAGGVGGAPAHGVAATGAAANGVAADSVEVDGFEAKLGEREFGLMTPLVRRWRRKLPQALAEGAGEAAVIPPGNDELIRLSRKLAASAAAPAAG
jgi:hypothetical protein